MKGQDLLNENWQVLVSLLPENWRSLAKETGASKRSYRSFSSEEAVFQTILLHVAKGYSLRETVVKAKLAGIADVSDVALLKRLKASEGWLKSLCEHLFKDFGLQVPVEIKEGYRFRAVDGTQVKEPGKTGSSWRLHYSLNLGDLSCDEFKVTPAKGRGMGESYKQFSIKPGDCLIGDRAYASASGIRHIEKQGGYSLVRVNTNTLRFYDQQGEAFPLLDTVNTIREAGKTRSWEVYVKTKDDGYICGRVCIMKKSKQASKKEIKSIQREAKRKKVSVRPETLVYAKYIIVFTTLKEVDFDQEEIMKWYRCRWQIELLFKRLKSLVELGHLPKFDEQSSRAWIYAKLMVALLVEKLIKQENFSPWGYGI